MSAPMVRIYAPGKEGLIDFSDSEQDQKRVTDLLFYWTMIRKLSELIWLECENKTRP